MRQGNGRAWGWGCLLLAAGLAIGASTAVLGLLAWTLARPAPREALRSQALPIGYDIEVRLSEAFLNRMVADELAERQVDVLTRITLDAQAGNLLVATLSGPLELGEGMALPSVATEVRLGILDGGLEVRIERIQAGPLWLDRAALPGSLQPILESAEERVASAVNGRLVGAGLELWEVHTDDDGLTLGVTGAGEG